MNTIEIAWSILDQVKAAKGKEKEKLLREVQPGHVREVLKQFFKFAFDPFCTFGIDVMSFPMTRTIASSKNWWMYLVSVLEQLAARKLTGNKARQALEEALGAAAEDRWLDWAIPMVRRNVTIGVSNVTLEKIWPGLLRSFSCQLADEFVGKLPEGGGSLEPKYDGLRGIFLLDPANPQALSRNGKPLNNVSHIVDELMPVFAGYAVDGELFANDWRSSVGAARSSESGDTSSRLRAFDLLPIEGFLSRRCGEILLWRQQRLDEMLREARPEFTQYTAGLHVDTVDDVMNIAAQYLKAGFEGGVLKDPQSLYTFDRSRDWQKVKKFHTIDAKVVDFEEGTGRNKGRLGAIVIEANGISRSKVGSGFVDLERASVWNAREYFLGKIAEVQFFEKTPDGCLRFPTFLRWRDDKQS